MAFEEAGAVVDLVMDDEPGLLCRAMRRELLLGNHTLDVRVGHDDRRLLGLGRLLHHRGDVALLLRRWVGELRVEDIAAFVLDSLHPAALLEAW